MSRLKPCPFCGGEVKWKSGAITCDKCYLEFRKSPNTELNIKAWNTRKPMDDVLKLINRECQGYFEAGMIHERINNYETANVNFNKYKALEKIFEKVRKVIKCD